MFDTILVWQFCPSCHHYQQFDFQTKDLDCLMYNYVPLPEDWWTEDDGASMFHANTRRRNQTLTVFPKFPKDKEHTVWVNRAERREAAASLEEPFASQLKFVYVLAQCSKCDKWIEGHIAIEKGMLIGELKQGIDEKSPYAG